MKLQKQNSDGKLIIKDVPENLVANYLQIGWSKFVERKPLVEDKKNISSKSIKSSSANGNLKQNGKNNRAI